jgi:hypothetical protein
VRKYATNHIYYFSKPYIIIYFASINQFRNAITNML